MTYPQELQAYYDAHDRMMDVERWNSPHYHWPRFYGLYKVARYSAVKAGYLPEQPEFG
jgi:hypothetical protein